MSNFSQYAYLYNRLIPYDVDKEYTITGADLRQLYLWARIAGNYGLDDRDCGDFQNFFDDMRNRIEEVYDLTKDD